MILIALSVVVSSVLLLALQIYNYLKFGDDVKEERIAQQELNLSTINLKPPPPKKKKLKVDVEKPKLARASAEENRFKLDLGANSGTGISLGAGDTESLLYDVSQVERLPVRIRGRSPKAPNVFVSSGLDGSVELEMVIEIDGSVSLAKVVKEDPVGFGLGDACIAVVKRWRFRPALLKGIPVRLRVIQPFSF